MIQLKSARGDRTQHYANLNDYSRNGYPAHQMLGKFWQIDEDIYDEFLGMLPPVYCAAGFRICEHLTGSIASTFQKIGNDYWCSMTDRSTTTPEFMFSHIAKYRSTHH